MADEKNEIYRQHRTAQDKYTYFLLGTAAACIALTVQRTTNSSLVWADVLLGCAVFCWGFSFSYGCQHISCILRMFHENMSLLKVEQGTHPRVENTRDAIDLASKRIRKEINSINDKSERCKTRQFNLLVLGALLFLIWHVIGMFLNTIESVDVQQAAPPIRVPMDDNTMNLR